MGKAASKNKKKRGNITSQSFESFTKVRASAADKGLSQSVLTKKKKKKKKDKYQIIRVLP